MNSPAPLRALIVVRLSNLTDETTSPERQTADCRAYCDTKSMSVVGVVEDLDVSASKVSPFDRPALRPWLARHDEYDVIVVWRVDRLVRSVFDLVDMIRWGDEHRVGLVSATEPHFDTTSDFGRIIALVIAMVAQLESAGNAERSRSAYQHNMTAGKWRGGVWPYGYRAAKNADGVWRLQIDPVTSKTALRIVEDVIGGKRPTSVCRELNSAEILTPQDYQRTESGKTLVKRSLWRTSNLTRMLRSPAMLGYAAEHEETDASGTKKRLTRPKTTRHPDGTPVVRAPALIERVTFDQLQTALDSMNGARPAYKKSSALLLRVAFCAVCGGALYLNHGRGDTMYYRCVSASLGQSCGNRGVRQEHLEDAVQQTLLYDLGDVERMRRVYDPGADASQELAETDAQLADAAELIGTPGFTKGTPGRSKLEARLHSLGERREALALLEHRPAGYRYEPTGDTFAEHWERLDTQERNAYLRHLSVRVEFRWLNEVHIIWGELEKMREHAATSN